jgi:predicted phosphodiesterase
MMMKLLNDKKIIISIGIIFFAILIFVGSLLFNSSKKQDEIKIGWVTDIHAGGSGKRAVSESNVVYPKQSKHFFNSALREMQNDGIETVISTGDQTNGGNTDYARKIKKVSDGYPNLKMLWVKGNHDVNNGDRIMSILEAPADYYFYDTKRARIIVLDIELTQMEVGNEQLDWLKDNLSNSRLPVIIAMHAPIVNYETGLIYPQYAEMEKIISLSNKVKAVVSGHTHLEYRTTINGVAYATANPVTLKDHMGSYYEININTGEIIGKNTHE